MITQQVLPGFNPIVLPLSPYCTLKKHLIAETNFLYLRLLDLDGYFHTLCGTNEPGVAVGNLNTGAWNIEIHVLANDWTLSFD